LDTADLFVHPSRTEGLPRALIEAMARGLPCIGSNVGGIPELLSPAEQVPAGDANALEAKLCEVLGDPQRLVRLSRENLAKAREYHADALRPRRQAFYRAVLEATSRWQRQRPGDDSGRHHGSPALGADCGQSNGREPAPRRR
jgi:glycosyltransferase involved in cell wall biosynthesis